VSSSTNKEATYKLALQVLRGKPSYSKNNAEIVKQFLFDKTGLAYERDEVLQVCKEVRNEFYPRKENGNSYDAMAFVNHVHENKIMLRNNEELDINSPLIKRVKNDRLNMPGLYLVLPCVHVPFHNKVFWNAMLKYIMKYRDVIQGILIIGDFLDMNSLSNHDKGFIAIPGVTLDYEYKEGNKALDELDQAMGRTNYTKYYLFGNHEDRYFRTIREINNSKYGSSLLSPITALKLVERGYNVLSDWKNDSIKLGPHLELMHGEFITAHAAKKHIDVYRKSIVFAHTHRINSYLEGQTAGYNIGFMGDSESPAFGYASRGMKSNWNNGMGLVHLDDSMYFNFQQVIWYDNCFYIGHEKFE
jgi:hypothetical protein